MRAREVGAGLAPLDSSRAPPSTLDELAAAHQPPSTLVPAPRACAPLPTAPPTTPGSAPSLARHHGSSVQRQDRPGQLQHRKRHRRGAHSSFVSSFPRPLSSVHCDSPTPNSSSAPPRAQTDEVFRYDAQVQKDILRARPWKQDPHHFKKVRISAVALIKMVRLWSPGLTSLAQSH